MGTDAKMMATKIDPLTIVFAGELDTPVDVAIVAEEEIICKVNTLSLVDGFTWQHVMFLCSTIRLPQGMCYYFKQDARWALTPACQYRTRLIGHQGPVA